MSKGVTMPRQAITNTRVCSKCGGECCKRAPGLAVPSDFGITRRQIIGGVIRAVSSGKWIAMRKHWTMFKHFAIRPRHDLDTAKFITDLIYGRCALLTGTGCLLSPERRPQQCRVLKPGKSKCSMRDDAHDGDIFRKWEPYQEELISGFCLLEMGPERSR